MSLFLSFLSFFLSFSPFFLPLHSFFFLSFILFRNSCICRPYSDAVFCPRKIFVWLKSFTAQWTLLLKSCWASQLTYLHYSWAGLDLQTICTSTECRWISPVTDNCHTWVSSREKMPVKLISGTIWAGDLACNPWIEVKLQTWPAPTSLNSYMTNGLFHPNQLDKSISKFRGVWCIFLFWFYFS